MVRNLSTPLTGCFFLLQPIYMAPPLKVWAINLFADMAFIHDDYVVRDYEAFEEKLCMNGSFSAIISHSILELIIRWENGISWSNNKVKDWHKIFLPIEVENDLKIKNLFSLVDIKSDTIHM
ncbi:hypothetical protein HZS_1651 [Henneguya salminicola]|nr:hypothetical protein HZS_1651 [Henneguya salminicola]